MAIGHAPRLDPATPNARPVMPSRFNALYRPARLAIGAHCGLKYFAQFFGLALVACYISRSYTVGMPSILVFPFALGISTARTATG